MNQSSGLTKNIQQHIYFHAIYSEQYSTDTSMTFSPGGLFVIGLEKCHLQEFSDSIMIKLYPFHMINKSTACIKCTDAFHCPFGP